MSVESIFASSRLQGPGIGQTYNEAAFRYFLAIERERAERLLLILVRVRKRPEVSASLTERSAAVVFAALGACVREVDLVGWYREGLVAAAVLALNDNASGHVRQHVADRLVRALNQRLPRDQAARLRVRVVELGGRTRI